MSSQEFTYWRAYYGRKKELEDEAGKNAKKTTGRADIEFKKTMGSGRE